MSVRRKIMQVLKQDVGLDMGPTNFLWCQDSALACFANKDVYTYMHKPHISIFMAIKLSISPSMFYNCPGQKWLIILLQKFVQISPGGKYHQIVKKVKIVLTGCG